MADNELTHATPILALAADMIFGAKIRGAAQTLTVPLTLARNPAHLLELVKAGSPVGLVIIDLDTRGLDITQTIHTIRTDTPGIRILAYVAHVNTAAIKAAREAGAHKVLARSAFAATLPEILQTGGL